MMLLMMHQTHLHQPWRLDRCNPIIHSFQVTSTVGNTKEQKVAFFQKLADDLNSRLGVRKEDVFISLVFVDREDWSFGNGKPW